MLKHVLLCILLCLAQTCVFAQKNKDTAPVVKKFFDTALQDGQSYQMLDYLSNQIGGRLSGSPQAAAAVEWGRQIMESYGFDTVFLQPVMVPHWVRGEQEVGKVINSKRLGSQKLNICALGNSVGTGKKGVVAKLLEVKDFDQLKALGKEKVAGKIVFFNRPMEAAQASTFTAYGGAVDQRVSGASEAAKLGAVGVIVRSMTLALDDFPHTGTLRYQLNVPQIPAVAISTNHAELLSDLLQDDPDLQFYFQTNCQTLPDVLSYNVVGEIKGSEKPEEYILVGGHLDSWDLADGSHDDGAGCVQSIEALRLFKALGIRPKHTLRTVLFMNEENGLRGGRKYAEFAEQNKEKHLAAIESDRGGFVPRGFGLDGTKKEVKKLQSWADLFAAYGIHQLGEGYGGADIGPLKNQGVPLIGLVPDSQRYFDYHHAANDTFDKVSRRELELGAAAMAALLYLIDTEGL